jgi:diguanylate cyclase (GGDEF)-like protein/PAS domain S-box-containing protein
MGREPDSTPGRGARASRPPRDVAHDAAPLTARERCLEAELAALRAQLAAVEDGVEQARRESEQRFKSVVEGLREAIVITDLEDTIVYANSRATEILGFEPDQLLGHAAIELLFPPEWRARMRERVAERTGGASERYEIEVLRADGSRIWVEISAAPYRDASGQIVGTLGAITDISRRRLAEDALRQSEARYSSVLADVHEVVFSTDAYGRWTFLSPSWEALVGATVTESLGCGYWDFLHPDDFGWSSEAFAGLGPGERASSHEIVPYLHRDGTVRWVEARIRAVFDARGRLTATHGTLNDVTERKDADQAQADALIALRASEGRLRAIVDNAAVGITEVDARSRIINTNRAFQRIMGYSAEELHGRTPGDFSHPDDEHVTDGPLRDLAAGVRDSVTVEKRYVRKDGEVIWASITISRVESQQGTTRFIGVVQNITERKELEAQLTRQAFHDPVTGLANRALFRDRVAHAMRRDVRDHGRAAVLLLDLDGFKTVNDSFGHETGDRLLTAVGARLATCLRGSDTVARLGGDEFGILTEDIDSDGEAVGVAERIVAALRAPIVVDEKEVFVGASIGIAHSRDAQTAEDLLRNADVAMYTAKSDGKGRYTVFETAMHARVVERQQIEADLRLALERNELRLVYQPIVRLETGAVTGVEALLRWDHPTRGAIPPGRFIGVAEDTGLIVPIGRWVLNEACRQAAEWRARDRGAQFTMSVNISGRQLEDPHLIDDIRTALETTGLPPRSLLLEITESVIMHDTELTLARLTALKALGVRLAIDDFGTGYSSLSYLQRFPMDVIKIDKSFTDGIAQGPHDAALVRTIVSLSETLRLRTVAEGIEGREQCALLAQMGCELGQGYLFAKPLPACAMGAMLAEGGLVAAH